MFKSLLKTGRLLRDFFEVFLPDAYSFIDFDHIEFVDKERFTMQGKRRTGDLLIKTKSRGEDAAFLIHLEHEAQARANLALRMLEYFLLDWRDFGLPVYPVAVLSHPEFNPQTKSPLSLRIRDQEILKFHFAVIDLARLDAREYVGMPNTAAMALSSRMHVNCDETVATAIDFIRNITQKAWSESELESISSYFLAYQEFGIEDALKLKEELSMIENMELPKEILEKNPIFQFVMDKGERQGRQQGEANLVLRQLARRVGSVTPAQEAGIRKLPLADIEALGEALLDFVSAADLAGWLQSHSG
jgi:hypothetical protein